MSVIKESSDELNPVVVTKGVVLARQPKQKTARDLLALGIATCGVGYIPIAPGTWGSLVGVALYLLMRICWPLMAAPNSLNFTRILTSLQTPLILITLVVLTFIGIWAATRAEPLLGRKDPGPVVIDEVVGQLITYLFVPFNSGWLLVIIGFLLFRLFDIWKPYPIYRLEALESGLGIMADDVLAGVYAAIVLSILSGLFLFI